MMSELKTLKEIQICDYVIGGVPIQFHMRNVLKAEAIKWVKEIKEGNILTLDHPKGDKAIISWIKHFFNLTEEELKNE